MPEPKPKKISISCGHKMHFKI